MRTFEELCAIGADIRCPPYEYRIGCVQCIQEMLMGIRNVTFHSHLGVAVPDHCDRPTTHVWFVQACLWRRDTHTNVWGWGYGSQLLIRSPMTNDEIVRKFFVAARDYSEHEVREAFEYKGRKILGPHISVDDLWGISQ